MKKGKIFTFYSYKGGTGRTMAIVNIAMLLAKESNFRTLVIDWDLEAPGLDRYLKPYCCRFKDGYDLLTTPGIIDYFEIIQEQANLYEKEGLAESDILTLLNKVPFSDFVIETEVENLSFVKAGAFTKNYSKKINEFKWEGLFRQAPSIYKKFAEMLTLEYDFILIDSRTGLTDTSGICTMILPEKLILVFTPNYQNLEGVTNLGEQAIAFRRNSGELRPLKIYPLPSRIEMAEKELREQWRKGNLTKNIEGYQSSFERLFEKVYGLEDVDFTSYFDEIQIQHEPRFSYGEEIAVANRIYSDRLSMAESYNKLLNKLLSDDCIWDYKKFTTNNNLPVNQTSIIGREMEMATIMKAINSRFPIISIVGPPGIGKSILALEISHQCLSKVSGDNVKSANFEYVIWISAKNNLEQKRRLNELLNMIGEVMGYTRIKQQPEQALSIKEQDVNELLSANKSLIILNNLELIDKQDPDEKQLTDWIKNIPEPSKILITTRTKSQHIPSLSIEIPGMNDKDVQKLLDSIGHDLNDNQTQELIKVSKGNPKMLELLLGIMKIGTITIDTILNSLDTTNIPHVFNHLHEETLKHLSTNSKFILLSFPIFGDTRSVEKNSLLATSGLTEETFEIAIQELNEWNLIKTVDNGRFFIHPITKEIMRFQLKKETLFEQEARERWSTYYVNFIKMSVVRIPPDDIYWNVLVSKNMLKLDSDWISALEVLKWADETSHDKLLIDLIMLLVHYMDSRLYNVERLYYVQKAIAATQRSNLKYAEALLRIDALGWTYVEENNPIDAKLNIERGMEIAEELEVTYDNKKNELLALGNVWKARSKLGQKEKQIEDARRLIGIALTFNDISPWITFRVNMAAGDIELKANEFERALEYYEKAKQQLTLYGGEGNNYQIDPRIGIACIGMHKIEKAEKLFKKLSEMETIPIGHLYGEYGIALVNFIRGDLDTARRMLRNVKEELKRRTTSNLLLDLIEDIEVDIIKNLTQYQDTI